MISLRQAAREDRELLWNVHQKYLYEMTNFYDDPMDDKGNYGYGYFDAYFTDPARLAFFILEDGKLAGFAMINPYSNVGGRPDHVMAEFTVFPAFRRRHAARDAANAILEMLPGSWEIKYNEKNAAAKALWNGVAAPFSPARIPVRNNETVLAFSTASPSAEASAPPAQALRFMRATETWQQAGAYYVRIQAMAKKHGITLRQEFDGHDRPDTKYIVATDGDFPVATARMYPLNEKSVMIGRVVVLPEYRRRGVGTNVVRECEAWAKEEGFENAVLESRDNKVAFYQRMGYRITGEMTEGVTFRCIRMEKEL